MFIRLIRVSGAIKTVRVITRFMVIRVIRALGLLGLIALDY